MIEINFDNGTYICPFCGCAQAYERSHWIDPIGLYGRRDHIPEEFCESALVIHSFHCSSKDCNKTCVTSINRTTNKQFDIIPESTYIHFPEFIPVQIRNDYEEAAIIIDKSPKAAATLLRRCLQGMIHDFWGICEKTLYADITALKSKVTPTQWEAIDGLRKIGNIGAHMESDVNLIIDISRVEAKMLLELIELLFNKWYIARNDEKTLLTNIGKSSSEKDAARVRS